MFLGFLKEKALVAIEDPAEMCTQQYLKKDPHSVPRCVVRENLWLHTGTEDRQTLANTLVWLLLFN